MSVTLCLCGSATSVMAAEVSQSSLDDIAYVERLNNQEILPEENIANSDSKVKSVLYSKTSTYNVPDSGTYAGVLRINGITGQTLSRTNMTVTVSGFNYDTYIRIMIYKTGSNKLVFDTLTDTTFSYMSTDGYYQIGVNLPASSSFYVICDIMTENGNPISSGNVKIVNES